MRGLPIDGRSWVFILCTNMLCLYRAPTIPDYISLCWATLNVSWCARRLKLSKVSVKCNLPHGCEVWHCR